MALAMKNINSLFRSFFGSDGDGDDEHADPIEVALVAARQKYKEDWQDVMDDIEAHFGQRERAARDAGRREVVLQIVNERRSLHIKNEWPKSTPDALLRKKAAVQANMESAYRAAIAAYTKASLDTQALLIEEEAQKFRQRCGRKQTLGPRVLWAHATGYFVRGRKADWFEKSAPPVAPREYVQVDATSQYVELRRIPDNALIRLLDNRAQIKADTPEAAFEILFEGQWHVS